MVSGSTGFVGNNLVRHLLKTHLNTRIIGYSKHTYADNPSSTLELSDNPNYVAVKGDIRDELLLLETIKKHGVEKIFHLAASTHVDRSFDYPEEFFNINAHGTFAILEVLKHLDKKPLMIQMSTDEVFGDVPEKFCREDDVLSPRNPYSASKAAAEAFCNAYYHSFKVPVIIARSMNMYGPYQHPEKLIPKIIVRCINDTHFTLYEGNSVRGWAFVRDVCAALDLLSEKGIPGEIYHIPPDDYLTVSEVAQKILDLTGKHELFDGYKGRRLKDDERYALDCSKFVYKLKWKPKTSFEQGMKDTIQWFTDNKWFWCGTTRII